MLHFSYSFSEFRKTIDGIIVNSGKFGARSDEGRRPQFLIN
ncbi:hypothetical protein [Rickettsia endosymbiont of Culicoides newsteadi]|nr:hypothetical protein [Rickettsia endosymbiont of Culicoides newsteadi]